jgi:predicted dehydrogenase
VCDPALDRAERLAAKFNIPNVVSHHHELAGLVDAALVATPNHLHAQVTCDLLKQGIHVNVEKIMALTTADALAMVEAAAMTERVLTVGLEFRYFTQMRFVRQLLALGLLGDIERCDIRLGVVLKWPMKSDYLMKRASAGGGVLTDFGPHILDLVLWWLGDWATVEYADDALGGVEANATIHLRMATGAAVSVELSRNRVLRNSAIITGSNGRLEVGLWDPLAPVRLELRGETVQLEGLCQWPSLGAAPKPETFHATVARQWTDMAVAIRERRQPFVTGVDGVGHVRLIETCYAKRTPLRYEWEAFPANDAESKLTFSA